MNFLKFHSKFKEYHTHPITISVHMITVLISTMYIYQYISLYKNVVTLSYTLLLYVLGTNYKLSISSMLMIGMFTSLRRPISTIVFGMFIIIQYLSHVLMKEKTMISTYLNTTGFIRHYVSHLIFTIPSVIHLFFQRVVFPSNQILLDKIDYLKNRTHLINWISSKIDVNDQSKTTHWWYNDLQENECLHFDVLNDVVMSQIQSKLQSYEHIQPIHQMNEIYVSTSVNKKYNSDNVFYSKHIDGPFYLYPFCSVKRVILSINNNSNITTIFPNNGIEHMLTDGEFVVFDFNRDIHYIKSSNEVVKQPRMTLKLHYVVYPKLMYYPAMLLKKLNVMYDKNARDMFLYTLQPKSLLQKLMSCVVNLSTNLTYLTEQYIGISNLLLVIPFVKMFV